MVYIPSILHSSNAGSSDPKGEIPFLYSRELTTALFVGTAVAYFFDERAFYAMSATLAFVLFLKARVWVWTHNLFPWFLRSNYLAWDGRWDMIHDVRVENNEWLVIQNPAFEMYATRKIPLFVFIEAYRRGDVTIAGDDLDLAFQNMNEWSISCMTWDYAHFLLFGYILDVFVHSRAQDVEQVQEHYDGGNDLFSWFLGHRMVYTSGYYFTGKESLEEAQDQKMEVVARKIQLEKGHRILDLGCGWGTWTLYTASKWGTHTTGLSIAREQIAFAKARAARNNITNVDWVCSDYRDMPRAPRFDRVTCFEMAEHVGIKRFQEFLAMVWDALEDDGIFYLQIAGLREKWQYEEVQWGLFMWKYIFRGADASLPLNWITSQLECAGFAIQSAENIDFHYCQTIRQWRENWISNKDTVIKEFGEEIFRIYDIFLSWSPNIGDRGGSTCWQIVCYKNLDKFDRRRFLGTTMNAYQKTPAKRWGKSGLD